jgi:L-2-hydroxyglutarate oxidase LhgO
VIHAGFYYPAGSRKARCCVRGRQLLYEYCAARGVPHRRTGKLVVAADADGARGLEKLLRAGAANGVDDMRWLEPDEAKRLEPHVACVAALDSPSSGIVDVPELVMALVGELEQLGGG